jgi:hypothetical protein
MKAYLTLGINIILVLYLTVFFLDNKWFPKEIIFKIRNLLFLGLLLGIAYNLVSIYLLKKQAPEDGLIYKFVNIVSHYYHAGFAYIQPFKKEMLIAVIITVVVIFISLMLVGIPGQLLIEISKKLGNTKTISGDNSWPAAIFVSLIWPLFIPLGVIVKYEISKNSQVLIANTAMAFTILGGMILSVTVVYLLFPSVKD